MQGIIDANGTKYIGINTVEIVQTLILWEIYKYTISRALIVRHPCMYIQIKMKLAIMELINIFNCVFIRNSSIQARCC